MIEKDFQLSQAKWGLKLTKAGGMVIRVYRANPSGLEMTSSGTTSSTWGTWWLTTIRDRNTFEETI